MKLSRFSDGSEPFPFASPASNVVCAVSPQGKESSPCQGHGQRYHLLILTAPPSPFYSFFFLFYPTFSYVFPTREQRFVCECVTKCMCFSLCIHPECMAHCQIQADNILKETLQYCILNSNYSNVYSNQRHNRWRGMSLWQAGRSCSSWSCGFWCLIDSKSRGTDSLRCDPVCSGIKEVLSAAKKGLKGQNKCAISMLSYYWSTTAIIFSLVCLLCQQVWIYVETAPCKTICMLTVSL